ncbi:MAG: DNA-protecting protein DprA [Nitrospirae bacterium]|nr:MAG: DNA-protecting protein DprA [Nitrospirota bacterium]
MTDARYWIGLSMVSDIGPAISKKLLAAFGSPREIFSAGMNDLLAVKGLNAERAGGIKSFDHWDLVDRQLLESARKSIRIVHYNDTNYPEVLKEVEGAPLVLYMKGEYRPEDRFAVAVVGARKYSDYGETVTRRISFELASAGFTIVSGMARGIDTFSHTSALAAGGRTVAVLGSGLDIYYPPENRGLMEKISGAGCALSEFPPGTQPNKENFPRRNRLISGLSLGVLVVEAAAGSGSLITARYALEQNREVFAVPGNITSVNSEGTNALIKQGATMVLDSKNIIEELAPMLKGFIKAEKREAASLTDEESLLCSHLTREAKHIDPLAREAGMPVQKLFELLLSLELKGIVSQAGGKRFYLS